MTTAMDTVPSDVAGYVEAVASHLASRPWLRESERDELLDDLAHHLAEVAAEDDTPLVERLGPPESYAEELLAAAGVGEPAPVRRAWRWRARLATAFDSDRRRAAWAFGRELEPAWWVVRGYLVASLLGAVTASGGPGLDYPGFPIPSVLDNPAVGLATLVAAVVVSVRWGRGRRPERPWVRRGSAFVLAVYGLSLLARVGDDRLDVRWAEAPQAAAAQRCLVNGAGQPIENLYPYDAEGRLLERVLLFDQTGRPLDNLCPPEYDEQGRPVFTEYGRDENGAPVINVFPRRQTVGPVVGSYGGEQPALTTATTVLRPPPAVIVPRLTSTTTTPPATTTTPLPPPAGDPLGVPTAPP